MARQLVFNLARKPGLDRDDFLISSANETAATTIERWRDWPSRTLLLIGGAGSGKTHLASIWADESGALAVGDVHSTLWNTKGRRLLLEDCDRSTISETDFFHLLNTARETEAWLLLTARTPPVAWELTTPDLISRLRLAPIVTIDQPDVDLMKAVLLKLFADRQILIDEEVVVYAARHCERSFEAANRFVTEVDEAALSERRRITRPLAVDLLSRLAR